MSKMNTTGEAGIKKYIEKSLSPRKIRKAIGSLHMEISPSYAFASTLLTVVHAMVTCLLVDTRPIVVRLPAASD